MYLIICIRKHNGKKIAIPIMGSDDEGETTDVMATWDELEEAQEFAMNNMLCKSSETYVIDLENYEVIEL